MAAYILILHDSSNAAQESGHLKKQLAPADFMGDVHLWMGACLHSCQSQVLQGAKCGGLWWHQVWGHVMSLGLRLLGSTALDNCVVLGKYCGESAVAARAVGVLSGASRSSMRDQGRWSRWCTHLAVRPAAGACVWAGTRCRHTCSGGRQGRQKGP